METKLTTELFSESNLIAASCPNCGNKGLKSFFVQRNVPVHGVMLVFSKEEAVNFPKGDIELGFCDCCGFIANLAFDPSKLTYSSNCEETQGFSQTFHVFHKNLAQKLVDKFNLFNKEIIEIGCGKGEFLSMLCEIGNNKGYGFDPAYVPERNQSQAKDRILFIEDFYSEKYSEYKADFICCKMTLEHIPNTLEFVSMLRRTIGDNLDTVIFFQIPDIIRVLKQFAFWDIYYEHCSYFSPVSLQNLFLKAGFEVTDLYRVYDNQYLMIEAKPSKEINLSSPIQPVEDVNEIYRLVSDFSLNIREKFNSWKKQIESNYKSGKKIVTWGGGSKAVSFFNTLGITVEIKYVVDINPFKHETFIVGTGQKVVSPEFLKDYKPDIVVVMNPIYMDEISNTLRVMGLQPELIPIENGR